MDATVLVIPQETVFFHFLKIFCISLMICGDFAYISPQFVQRYFKFLYCSDASWSSILLLDVTEMQEKKY